jgi:hypothetical protein
MLTGKGSVVEIDQNIGWAMVMEMRSKGVGLGINHMLVRY